STALLLQPAGQPELPDCQEPFCFGRRISQTAACIITPAPFRHIGSCCTGCNWVLLPLFLFPSTHSKQPIGPLTDPLSSSTPPLHTNKNPCCLFLFSNFNYY